MEGAKPTWNHNQTFWKSGSIINMSGWRRSHQMVNPLIHHFLHQSVEEKSPEHAYLCPLSCPLSLSAWPWSHFGFWNTSTWKVEEKGIKVNMATSLQVWSLNFKSHTEKKSFFFSEKKKERKFSQCTKWKPQMKNLSTYTKTYNVKLQMHVVKFRRVINPYPCPIFMVIGRMCETFYSHN